MSKGKWNPRYLAYCRAPGGCMCGSILWHSDKLNEARRTHREWFYIEIGGNVGGLLDHKGYDKWLQKSIGQGIQ